MIPTTEGWAWRGRQRVAALLPPEAVVSELEVREAEDGCQVRVRGRLGDVQVEWWAAAANPDEALDALILHIRRTPGEVLQRAYLRPLADVTAPNAEATVAADRTLKPLA